MRREFTPWQSFLFIYFFFIKQSSDVFAAGAAVTQSQWKPRYDNVTRRNPQCENKVISRNIGDILFSTRGVVALQQFDLVMATRFIKTVRKATGKEFLIETTFIFITSALLGHFAKFFFQIFKSFFFFSLITKPLR